MAGYKPKTVQLIKLFKFESEFDSPSAQGYSTTSSLSPNPIAMAPQRCGCVVGTKSCTKTEREAMMVPKKQRNKDKRCYQGRNYQGVN